MLGKKKYVEIDSGKTVREGFKQTFIKAEKMFEKKKKVV